LSGNVSVCAESALSCGLAFFSLSSFPNRMSQGELGGSVRDARLGFTSELSEVGIDGVVVSLLTLSFTLCAEKVHHQLSSSFFSFIFDGGADELLSTGLTCGSSCLNPSNTTDHHGFGASSIALFSSISVLLCFTSVCSLDLALLGRISEILPINISHHDVGLSDAGEDDGSLLLSLDVAHNAVADCFARDAVATTGMASKKSYPFGKGSAWSVGKLE
jgi:hypothetical protein